MSRRRKKVTVQVFANKRFPVDPLNGDSDETLFPAYITVIYNQKNTKFKVTIDDSDFLIRDETIDLEKPELKRYISEVETIVKNEINEKGEIFTLVGLSKRIEKYQQLIESSFDELIYRRLIETFHFDPEAIKKYKTIRHKGNFKIEIADTSGEVWGQIDKVTEFYIWGKTMLSMFSNGRYRVYDWKFGNAQKEFVKTTTSSNPNDKRNKLIVNILNNFFDYHLWE